MIQVKSKGYMEHLRALGIVQLVSDNIYIAAGIEISNLFGGSVGVILSEEYLLMQECYRGNNELPTMERLYRLLSEFPCKTKFFGEDIIMTKPSDVSIVGKALEVIENMGISKENIHLMVKEARLYEWLDPNFDLKMAVRDYESRIKDYVEYKGYKA